MSTINSCKTALLVFCAGVGIATFSPRANASEFDKKSTFTFNEPVEVPGRVLPAGQYVFRLWDDNGNRDLVQIRDTRGYNIAVIQAIPTYYNGGDTFPQKSHVIFEERAAGAPPAIKTWFYPGGNDKGEEFVYPKMKPVAVAAVIPPPPPPPAPVAEAAEAPKSEPPVVAKAEPAPAPAPPMEEAPAPAPAPAPVPEKSLPKTASNLALFGLAGMFSLAGGLGLRRLAKVLS